MDFSDTNLNQAIRSSFSRADIVLEENTAYQLDGSFPCDTIMEARPSSFLEIKK